MRVMFDTSAFAKRYIAEEGSDKIVKICQETTELFLCSLCLPEFISVIARLKRERKITSNQYIKIKTAFLTDIKDATLCKLPMKHLLKASTFRKIFTQNS